MPTLTLGPDSIRLTNSQVQNLKKLAREARKTTEADSVLLTPAEHKSLFGKGLVLNHYGSKYKGMVPAYLSEKGRAACALLFPVP